MGEWFVWCYSSTDAIARFPTTAVGFGRGSYMLHTDTREDPSTADTDFMSNVQRYQKLPPREKDEEAHRRTFNCCCIAASLATSPPNLAQSTASSHFLSGGHTASEESANETPPAEAAWC